MTKRGLLDVVRFVIPTRVLDSTLEVLAEAGKTGHEAFVVWGGVREGNDSLLFEIAYKPRQQSYKTEDGLLVRVEEDALFRLNKDFNERGLLIAGQAHSHPTDAYHSETDDHLPLVTILGGLSLVVPDFARGGRDDLDRFAWFRLAGYADWCHIDQETELVID